MFQKIAKHRANDASNDVHRPPLAGTCTVELSSLSTKFCILANTTTALVSTYNVLQVFPFHRVFHVGRIPRDPEQRHLRSLLTTRKTSRSLLKTRKTNLSSGFPATRSFTMLVNFSSRAFNSSTEASMSRSSCILVFGLAIMV